MRCGRELPHPIYTAVNQDELCRHDRGEMPQGVYEAKTRKDAPRKLTYLNIDRVEHLNFCHLVLHAQRDLNFLDGSLEPRHGEAEAEAVRHRSGQGDVRWSLLRRPCDGQTRVSCYWKCMDLNTQPLRSDPVPYVMPGQSTANSAE